MIRVATLADAEAIAEVQVEAWHAAYRGLMPHEVLDRQTFAVRAPRWRANLREPHPDRRTAVFERAGVVVGFASAGPSRDEDSERVGEIWALYATPTAWGTGVGRALLDDAISFLVPERYDAITLWVLHGNARAIRFYGAGGFRLDGARKQGELDEVRMHRALPRRPLT